MKQKAIESIKNFCLDYGYKFFSQNNFIIEFVSNLNVDSLVNDSYLIIKEEGAFLAGASSDHTIVDVEDAKRDIKLGDIIEFDVSYSTLVYVTNSAIINKVFIN